MGILACLLGRDDQMIILLHAMMASEILGSRAQQGDELRFDARGVSRTSSWFKGASVCRRHVGYAGDSEDANSTVACGDDLWNRGHADKVCTDGRKA